MTFRFFYVIIKLKNGGIILEIIKLDINSIKPYEKNAKIHTAEQVEQIKESIQMFGMNDPIAIWGEDNLIVEGHGRLEALKELGYTEVECIRLDHLTDEERKAYTLAHNKLTMNTDFDFDILNDELKDIVNIDMEDFGFDVDDLDTDIIKVTDRYDIPAEEKGSLSEQYIVPPFSILDTRQGYWQQRKDYWLNLTGNLSETRGSEFGTIGANAGNADTNFMACINGGTSNFDPVLAEIVYTWFCVPGGKIIDPFGGEQTKGVVAGELGFNYQAVEIRQDQVALNREKTSQYPGVKYYCGDSNNIDSLIEDEDFDLCFTSPPYYDLEVYSKKDMSALGTYEEFMEQYKNIFKKCYDKMNDHSFLVVKVAEIRDKKTGQCRCFVADNIKCMEDIGFKFYNDIVLINTFGTAPLRVNNYMKNRKVVKVHQNVLVFYKGDLSEISNYYPLLNFDEGADSNADEEAGAVEINE